VEKAIAAASRVPSGKTANPPLEQSTDRPRESKSAAKAAARAARAAKKETLSRVKAEASDED